MKRVLALLVFGFALPLWLAVGSSAEIQPSDAREVERAGCRIRTARVDAGGIATVSADCRWQLAPEAVVATVRHPERLGDALSSLRECTRLPDGRVLQVHKIGWPLGDRQVTLDWRETGLPDGGIRLDYRRADRQEPLAEGRVAIVEDEGLWVIRPDGTGGTRLSYTSRYDAGGSLKPWVVRRFQKDGIATSLEELRAAAADR
jgi:Polyketide cyclase / dehydrase and lipid transport